MYQVIRHFVDLQDRDYPYYVGDTFPRQGLIVNDTRILELSGSGNKQGVHLIRLVEENKKAPKRAKKTAKV